MSGAPSSPAAPRSGRTVPPNNRVESWMGSPSLLVYAHRNSRGMRVSAVLYHPWEGKHGRHEVLFRHEWAPSEVTELSIVEWATRALARWLEGQLMPETDS